MPKTAEQTRLERADKNRRDNLQHHLDQFRNIVLAHDHVHPDRNECGGVGGCKILMTEADAESEITNRLEQYVRAGLRVVVSLERP